MSDIIRRPSPPENPRKKAFFDAVKYHGAQALNEMAVCNDGEFYPGYYYYLGQWYHRKKTPIMERKAHYKTMLAMMLLARPPAESQPQPHMWLPVELWDMVTHEFLPPQDHLYAMLTQNGTNEIVMADLEAF